MTAPAPSPESPQAAATVDKKSRKVYVLWGIALTLLISTAVFCWLVVVPVMKVRAAASRYNQGAGYPSREEMRRLGGPEVAARRVKVYLSVSVPSSPPPIFPRIRVHGW
jgi:hypothetical protein